MGLWEGRGQTDREVDLLILDVAKFQAETAKFLFWSWQESGKILFFQRRNSWQNFAAKHLSLQKLCHRPSSTNFTASLAEIFWSVTVQFVRGSGKAESRKFTARFRHREVWETGRSGSHRLDRERSPVPHQSWEPGSREKWQAPWVSKHGLSTFLGFPKILCFSFV